MAVEISPAVKRALEQRLGDRAVFPNHPRYEETRRIWNGMIDLRPGVLAQATDAAEVAYLVDLARDAELPLAVRGGGHNVAGLGLCEGGLVIDLALMRGARIDPESDRAFVQGGCLLGDVDAATQLQGRAVPAGVVSHTGVGGLALGGGVGWLCRRHGLTCDYLRGAEIVTADGEVRRIDDAGDPDLMWALRGGGGNFGVVTEFEFETVARGPVLIAKAIYPFDQIGELAPAWREIVTSQPEDMMTSAAYRRAVPLPVLPTELHGELVWGMVMIWAGDHEEGREVMNSLLDLGRPALLAPPAPMPYVEMQSMLDANQPHGLRYYEKTAYLEACPDDALDLIVEGGREVPGPESLLETIYYGGAVSRVADDATAFPNRDLGFAVQSVAVWTDPAEDGIHRDWARRVVDRLEPWSRGGYVNYFSDEAGGSMLRDIYGKNLDRLRRVKGRVDPDNLFRRNQNIEPAP